jgi:hypothetical protein
VRREPREAVYLNSVFSATREDEYSTWAVTHRLTGFAAGHASNIKNARQMAAALIAYAKPELWNFTDPEHVRGSKQFAKCRAIRDKYGF